VWRSACAGTTQHARLMVRSDRTMWTRGFELGAGCCSLLSDGSEVRLEVGRPRPRIRETTCMGSGGVETSDGRSLESP
jgi:hypothetical protein